MYKKFILGLAIGLFIAGSAAVLAAPVATVMRSILPETDNLYYLGTTTPKTYWANIYTQGLTVSTGTATTTLSSGVSTLQGFVSQASSTVVGNFTVTGTCTGCGAGLSGGSPNSLAYWTSATALSATSSPTISYLNATTTTASIFAGQITTTGLLAGSSTVGFINATSSTASTFAGGVTITCTACLTDANVADNITLTNITQITNRAITDTTGTLTEGRGGTNQTTYAAGDTLYASAVNTLSKLTAGASSTVLTINASGLPIWTAQPALTTLSISNLLSIPSSATLTTGGLGQIGIDTTTGQLRYNDGSVSQVLVATSSFGFEVSSTTLGNFGGLGSSATSTLHKRGFFGAISVTEIACQSKSTTTAPNAILQIGTGSASATPIIFCNNAGQVVPLTAGNTFGANANIFISIGTASGTVPDYIFPDIRYKWTSD